MEILQTIFVDPFLNIFIGIQAILPGHDFGMAIIVLTLFVRAILYPLSAKQIRSQRAMQDLQPRINEIRQKHKDNKEAQTKALMEFYKKNKINPLSSCGPMLVQLAFIYPLYWVFRLAVSGTEFADRLYPFIPVPEMPMNTTFMGLADLSINHNILLAVLTAGAQFIQSWMLMRKRKKEQPAKKDAASAMSKNIMYIFPLMTGYFAYQFPAGLGLYWFASTVFAIAQQFIIMRTTSSVPKDPSGEHQEIVVK